MDGYDEETNETRINEHRYELRKRNANRSENK